MSDQDFLSSIKDFHFTNETDIIEISCSSSDSLCSGSEMHICSSNCLKVSIRELLDPSFGMYVWPCAPVLGKYVWFHKERLKNKAVLELGAGTSLASIVAAKCGSDVVVTDSMKYSSTLQLARENMLLNKIPDASFKIMPLTWGDFTPYLIQLKNIDFILGSDVFYDAKDFEDLIVTVSFILKRNIQAEFWCSYEHRCSDWNINYLIKKWNLTCEEIPLQSFGADGYNIAGYDLPGLKTISLFVFRHIDSSEAV
ncbi:histone-arginine methyltransferase METTL23-like [Uloborus diversus]|uniref:histone-arginine methyltransferase METTL23-like n=1 Tax=Uloborus diversus TaxID=327109 RepID=UPI002409F1DC|nr:histone-arginine methyltransferase METTL23-like [Uloborus diversus]